MKLRALFLALALGCAGAAVATAQSAHMGTWKLNEAKSHVPPGVTKNSTVVYEAAGDSVKVTTDGTGADGQPSHSEWTGKFDGKDYPVSGDSTADMRAYRMVDDHTLAMANKKGGKVTVTGRIAVAPDGATRTVTLHGTDSSGNHLSSTAVYDKQ